MSLKKSEVLSKSRESNLWVKILVKMLWWICFNVLFDTIITNFKVVISKIIRSIKAADFHVTRFCEKEWDKKTFFKTIFLRSSWCWFFTFLVTHFINPSVIYDYGQFRSCDRVSVMTPKVADKQVNFPTFSIQCSFNNRNKN